MTEGAGSGAPPGAVLLTTKLHAAPPRIELVERGRLVEQLVAGEGRLTLVDAGAGWGKTTLLAEWRSRERGRVAWLTLEPSDNDPARFWTYVVTALQTVVPHVAGGALTLLRAPGASILDTVLPTLLEELTKLRESYFLVLDDYHSITNGDVHGQLTYFVERLPPTLRLVIASRSDPPLPLGRLRARGDLIEVRAEALRFSGAEASRFLNGVLRLGLTEADVARLHERTEGWAAGLYLAGLSLRGRADPAAFIDAFAGDDRHVVDYLASEVVDSQSSEVREFLLRTSILGRMSGPLCDSVTGAAGSASMLDAIERSNLFLVPLDARREWYRYHHLFGELLANELRRTEPALVPVLHRRAFEWLRDHGPPEEAIHHAVAAGATQEAAELVVSHWTSVFNQGRLGTVTAWLDGLPAATVAGDARLCVARAWIAMDRGDLEQVAHWIGSAERALSRARKRLGDGVQTEVALLRVVHSYKSGDLGAAAEAAGRALALAESGPEASFSRTVALCELGVTLFWQGHADEAREALETVIATAGTTGNDLARLYAAGYIALHDADMGDLDSAEAKASAALAASSDRVVVEHFVAMMAHLAHGRARELRGDLAGAEDALRRALELARRGAGKLEVAYALLALARLHRLRGDAPAARTLVRDAARELEGCADTGTVGEWLEESRREFRLAPRGLSSREEGPGDGDELTERELTVLRLLPTALTQREISAALYISLNTVKTHARGIYRKLDAGGREEAVARGRELGLI
jgi:LuxR family maltose regulon positive regulatory protein